MRFLCSHKCLFFFVGGIIELLFTKFSHTRHSLSQGAHAYGAVKGITIDFFLAAKAAQYVRCFVDSDAETKLDEIQTHEHVATELFCKYIHFNEIQHTVT